MTADISVVICLFDTNKALKLLKGNLEQCVSTFQLLPATITWKIIVQLFLLVKDSRIKCHQ